MKKEQTNRGFDLYQFKDSNGVECSIQKSSAATVDKIWLGANEIGLKEFKAGESWKEVELEDSISHHFVANNRMHLSLGNVRQILPLLLHFAATGSLDANEKQLAIANKAIEDLERDLQEEEESRLFYDDHKYKSVHVCHCKGCGDTEVFFNSLVTTGKDFIEKGYKFNSHYNHFYLDCNLDSCSLCD